MKLLTVGPCIGAILVGVAFGFASTSIAATDKKVFPGSLCVPTQSGTWATYSRSSILNYVDDPHNVSCPVVRDIAASTMDITDWDVTVSRGDFINAWDIKLWSASASGATGSTSLMSVPLEGAEDGPQNVDGGSITAASTAGVVYITSKIPYWSGINRYYIVESGTFD